MVIAHRRGPWSQSEDLYLLQLVRQDGASNWVRISHAIGTRSPKQCRERYHQNLKPTLNHEPITAEEGEQIEKMVNEMGKRWAEIARRLKGRSDNAVKNWWNGGQNRRRRGNEHRRADSEQSLSYVHDYPSYPPCLPMDHHQHHHHHDYRRPSVPPLDTGRFNHHEPPHFYSPQQQQQQHRYPPPPQPTMNTMHAYPPSMPLQHQHQHHHLAPSHHHHHHHHTTPLAISVQHTRPSTTQPPIEPPLPSPSNSLVSNDAPSLITDSGSESRSPQYASSPSDLYTSSSSSDHHRRRSSVRLLPADISPASASAPDDFSKVHLAPISQQAGGPEAGKGPGTASPAPQQMQMPMPMPMPMQMQRQQSQQMLPGPRALMTGSPVRSGEEPKKMALSAILA